MDTQKTNCYKEESCDTCAYFLNDCDGNPYELYTKDLIYTLKEFSYNFIEYITETEMNLDTLHSQDIMYKENLLPLIDESIEKLLRLKKIIQEWN